MNRILAGVIAAILLALSGAVWYAKRKASEVTVLTVELNSVKGALKTSNRLRTADASALKQSRAALAALAKQKGAQDEALSKALAANPAWADQRVPDAVVDALGMRGYPNGP